MVKLVTIDKNADETWSAEYYLHSMVPLVIGKTDIEGLFYVEFVSDVVTSEGNKYIGITLSFTVDSVSELKLIEENPFYASNLNKQRQLIYDKFKPAIKESYLTSFNMSRFEGKGYFVSKLYDAKTLECTRALYISENMFLRISLSLESLLKYGVLEFESFIDAHYSAMEKRNNIKLNSKNCKVIMNSNDIFVISREKNNIIYSTMKKDEYLKLKENL